MQTRRTTRVLANRYALDEEIGRSGGGMTLRAEDRLLGRAVAITLVHPDLGDDPAFAARLMHEARRVASLSSPGIARLLDTGEEDGLLFLVREHVDAPSARAILERTGPLPASEAAGIAGHVLAALEGAHAAGVLHLGLDLDGILVTPDGDAVVTNLGIGAAVTATRPAPDVSRFLGGEGLAPELAGEGVADERSDVFAVGAALFELLTGRGPAAGTSPRAIRPDVPRALDRVVARALARDPAARFPSVHAFAVALAEGAHGLGAEAGGATAEPSTGHDVLRTWLAAPLVIAVAAAAVIGLGLWFGRLEVGGPLGIRPADEARSSPPVASSEEVVTPPTVVTFDPFGDGAENDANVTRAIDGDRSTAWRSENYFDGSLRKPGVGLVFDLGASRTLTGFRLWAPNPGYVFHVAVGDDPDALVAAVGTPHVAERETRGAVEGSGRYVLVWITTVVPVDDGIRAEIAEFRVVVEAA